MKMEQAECSETSAYKIHTPENYPEESVQTDSCYCWKQATMEQIGKMGHWAPLKSRQRQNHYFSTDDCDDNDNDNTTAGLN
jgi:hypothetical protein